MRRRVALIFDISNRKGFTIYILVYPINTRFHAWFNREWYLFRTKGSVGFPRHRELTRAVLCSVGAPDES